MDGAFVVGCGSGVVVGKILCGVAARFGQIQHEQQSQHFPISTKRMGALVVTGEWGCAEQCLHL